MKKNKFNRTYKSVFIGIIILIILIIIFIFTIRTQYKPKNNNDFNEEVKTDEIAISKNYSCSNTDEISKDASNVKINESIEWVFKSIGITEDEEGTPGDIYGYALKFTLTGVTNNIYIQITNDTTDDVVNINSENSNNGTYIFYQNEAITLMKYDVRIYSNNDNCKDALFREFELSPKVYNPYTDYKLCENQKDSPYCAQLVDEPIDLNEFYENVSSKAKEETKNVKESEDKYKRNKIIKNILIILLIILIIIVLIFIIRTIIKNKNNKSETSLKGKNKEN